MVVAAGQTPWRWPLHARHSALLLWAGWLASYLIVLSFMGGRIHNYYLTMAAPPLAALAGSGLVALWTFYRRRPLLGSLLWVAMGVTAAWQVFIVRMHLGSSHWICRSLIIGVAVGVAGLLVAQAFVRRSPILRGLAAASTTVAVLFLLLSPGAWAVSCVLSPGSQTAPYADPVALSERNGPRTAKREFSENRSLIEFLRANQQGERYWLATPSALDAAPLIIESGDPVIAWGGFLGNDPALTMERFTRLVQEKQVRYVLTGGLPGMGGRGGNDIVAWVQEHGKVVPRAVWQPSVPRGSTSQREDRPLSRPGRTTDRPFGPPGGGGRGPGGPGGAIRLYDCRPEDGPAPASKQPIAALEGGFQNTPR
jgi:4-amino-4-deoxy-L-arabinose transferase-like glycosyltransferase